MCLYFLFFFFQAEDGIRDLTVTGVQTCALPIFRSTRPGERFRIFSLALVCAGAVGNVVDRLRSAQGVVDFVDVGIGSARWPTFTVADSAIPVGATALAGPPLLGGRGRERAKEARAAAP